MKYTVAFLAAVAAVNGSPMPMPQGVTSAIAPSGVAPSGCMPSYSGSFGIAVMNVTAGGVMSATQLPDGQPQATSAPVSQISDGQPQASTGAPAPAPPPVSQISDGQPQASTGMMSVPAVSQISDGQIQATPKPTMMSVPAVSQISDGQIQATPKQTMAPVSQISDGQIQATKSAPAVSQISDGQIQATKSAAPAVSQISDGQIQATTAPAVSQISDGQPQATGVSQISDGQPQATAAPGAPAPQMVACATDSTLTLTLEGGILKDNKGRTGYIASNYQFQFDNPPQAGAIYTAGWSVCANGSLTLGGDSIFYQCLSGNFYNLYNKNWAAQCNAVTIDVLELMNCPSS